jgi:hypothetical protein
MTSEPDIQIIGAYPLHVSSYLLDSVLNSRYGGPDDTPEQRARAIRKTHEELDRAVLFEVLVNNRDDRFSVDHFGQPGSDQAAYMERYLSQDGRTVLSRWKPPSVEPLHIVFFLHFVDPERPLRTSYGDRVIPALSPMPARLLLVAPYEPIGS